MSTDRHVLIAGASVRVSDQFDTTEGSADMMAMAEIIAAAARKRFFAEAKPPRMLPVWIDEPFPLVACKAHALEPIETTLESANYRCATCGQLATDKEEA